MDKSIDTINSRISGNVEAMQNLTKSLEETNQTIEEHHKLLQKRMSYAIDEVDQIKYQMHQLKSLFERVEVVETKMLDTTFEVKDLKASIPPSADHM